MIRHLILILPFCFSTFLFAHNPPKCKECCEEEESNTSYCKSESAHIGGSLGGESGNIYSERGEFYQHITDLAIPGRPGAESMVEFAFRRHYRSRLNADSAIGQNWFHNYFERMVVFTNRVAHDSIDRSDNYFRGTQPGTFISPPELFTVLTQDETDGTYRLRYPGGSVKSFDAGGRLRRIEDRKGNFMTFDYDADLRLSQVTDNLGRIILYRYISAGVNNGKLFEIEDFFGRKVQFKYNNNNDLIEVTSPAVTGTPTKNNFPNGKTTRYTYSSGFPDQRLNHNLLTITRPIEVANGGPPTVINEYGEIRNGGGFDRVIRQTYGGVNASGVPAGGTYSYDYSPRPNPEAPMLRTRETDRNGNVEEYEYNLLGYPTVRREFTRGLRNGEPPVFETLMEYNGDGQLTQIIYPEGNSIEYTYDEANPNRLAQGNLLTEKRIPDLDRGGDQAALITTYTYEPRFNQVKTLTDPRGNDPTFDPPNGGSTSPERYTTTFTFDYEVVGDPVLNPDGFQHGNIVRKEQPTVVLLDNSLQQIITEYNYNLFGQKIREIDPEGNVDEFFYFPENDPDGDGTPTPTPGLNQETGGYLKEKVIDSITSPRRTESTPPIRISNRFFYDPVGNMIRSIDGRGNDTLFFVNQLNQVVRTLSEAPFRYFKDAFYDFNGNVVKTRIQNLVPQPGSDGKPVFTGDGNFETVEGRPDVFIQHYTHDILDNIIKSDQDARGSSPARLVTQFRYDPNENRVQEILPEANIFAASYDERDLLFIQTRGFGSPDASIFTYKYDSNRNRIEMVDGQDNNGDGKNDATSFQFDGFDRQIGIIDAVGNQLTRHYDPNNNIVVESRFGTSGGPSPTDNSGAGNVLLASRISKHDELNRVFQRDDPLFVSDGVTTARNPILTEGPLTPGDSNISMQYLFDRNGRRVQEIEDDLGSTLMEYDGVDRGVKITDPEHNIKSFTYDNNNNATLIVETEVSQKTGVATETFITIYQYDSLDRLTLQTDNCGNTRRQAYDSRGNITHTTDAKDEKILGCPGTANFQGNSVRYTYDGLSRTLQVIQDLRVDGVGSGAVDTSNPFNPDGIIKTTASWDGNSRLKVLTDDNKSKMRYSYDALNRLKTEAFPMRTSKTYTYDRDDNVVVYKDNNETLQNCVYDAINRRVQCAIIRAPGVIGTTVATYEYDGLSRMTKMLDNNDPADDIDDSNIGIAYDSISRVIEEVQNGSAVTSDWFAEKRRVGISYPNDRKIAMSFDGLDRLKNIQDGGITTNIVEYDYIGADRVLERRYSNGTRLTYLDNLGTTDIGYDGAKRMIEQRHLRTDNSIVIGFRHAYDRENNKGFEQKLHDNPHSESYVYDSRYRIVDFEQGQHKQEWDLDGVGNWRVNTIDGVSQNRKINDLNEYVTINSTTLRYDKNGNLIDDGILTFHWDYQDRLHAVRRKSDDALLAVYSYDAMNRRFRKIVTNLGNTNGTTHFVYDNWRVLEERDGTKALLQQYVYGVYMDEAVVLDRNLDGDNTATGAGDQRVFYHQNTLYSVFALTDTTGTLIEGYHYEAYGTPTGLSSVGNPYMFTGQRFDPETGLMYYKNRYYSTELGRFLSRDRLGYDSGMNLYEYVQSNPINYTDPEGEQLRNPDKINCLGYATGEGCQIMPDADARDSLKDTLSKLKWTCGEKGVKSKDCECKCPEYMLMVYIYKYNFNPWNMDPWKDGWVRRVGQNDYHAIKCDDEPKKAEGKYKCKTGWSYVGSSQLKFEFGKPNPKAKPETIDDADSYWKGNVPEHAYCCCKPIE